jgi:hypothetical protein
MKKDLSDWILKTLQRKSTRKLKIKSGQKHNQFEQIKYL